MWSFRSMTRPRSSIWVADSEASGTIELGRNTDPLVPLRQGLPELNAVAIAVLDPGKLSITLILTLRVDPDSGGGELGEQRVQVVDTVVDHGLARLARARSQGRGQKRR